MLYTNIDVLRPAAVSFPVNVNNLLVVNNSVSQPVSFGHSTQLLDDELKNVSIETDSLSLFLLSALNQELDSKGFFSNNELIYNSINTSNDLQKVMPLTSKKVDELCESEKADVILSLNSLQTNDVLAESINVYEGEYVLSLDVVYDTWWTVQYPDLSKQTELLHFQDTVYWESSSIKRKELFDNFPDRKDALVDGALYVGQKMVNRLIPYWEEVDRYLFEMKEPLMAQGMDSVYAKNWNAAIRIWETQLEQTTSDKEKALILNNLAVAYEIDGNLDKAMSLITHATELYSHKFMANSKILNSLLDYKEHLLERIKQAILIKEQIAE
jgi:hypothetical protein